MKIHLWTVSDKFYWLDDDHVASGLMGQTAAGPFDDRDAAMEDARSCTGRDDVIDVIGETWPMGADLPHPDDPERQREADAIIAGMNDLTRQYVDTALWTGVERLGDDPLSDSDKLCDQPAHLIDPDTLREMIADCEKFQAEAGELLDAAIATGDVSYGPDCHDEMERAGHDFWLTRNGHGAGFWDGDWPEPYGDQLTEIAKKYGEYDLYLGDDGYIYG